MKCIFILVGLLSVFSLFAQQEAGPFFLEGEPVQENFQTVLNIELDNNYVFLPVVIQGKTYRFVFDTGASSAIKPALAVQLGLQSVGDTIAITDINQQELQSAWVAVPTFQLGDLTIEGANFWSMESKMYEILGVDGIIGSNTFEGLVVQVDKAAQQLTITDRLANLNLKKRNGQRLLLSPYQLIPYVNVYFDSCQNQAQGVLFDSGDNNFYTMSREDWNRWRAQRPDWTTLTTTNSSGVMGFAGRFVDTTTQYMFELPSLRIEHLCFGTVRSNTTAAATSAIGAGIFCYGKVTIDYQHERLFVEPYDQQIYAACRERHNRKNELGIAMIRVENRLEVAAVWKDWPADQAGLKEGMVVTQVNDQPAPSKAEDWAKFTDFDWRAAGDELELYILMEDGTIQRFLLR
jgi:hypothetical protein